MKASIAIAAEAWSGYPGVFSRDPAVFPSKMVNAELILEQTGRVDR